MGASARHLPHDEGDGIEIIDYVSAPIGDHGAVADEGLEVTGAVNELIDLVQGAIDERQVGLDLYWFSELVENDGTSFECIGIVLSPGPTARQSH